ncbi:MAG: hypothetical protein KAW88_03430 [Candidatus Cloacimonetes bacterium]|nr:hypothetical protein [Candidatus Cloacimonadota bacterium]
MKKIISRIKGTKPYQQQNFTQMMIDRERLVVFFSENPAYTFDTLSYIINWSKLFKEFVCIIPDFSYTFFKRITPFKNIKYLNLSSDLDPFPESIIFNFSKEKHMSKLLKQCKDSTIIDLNNPSNLQFVPTPDNPVTILENFAVFFNFPMNKAEIKIELSPSESHITKHRFIQNRFHNFILDINQPGSRKQNENLVAALKQNFFANLYLTGRKINKKNFINIVDIEIENLYEIYSLAKESDLFLSDNPALVNIFAKLGVNLIYLGEKVGTDDYKCINPQNVFELKNIIPEVMKK